MTILTYSNIRDVADALQGTCDDLEQMLQSVVSEDMTQDDMSLSDCQLLDSLAFLCDGCAWWHESAEMDGDQLCIDCSPDRPEED